MSRRFLRILPLLGAVAAAFSPLSLPGTGQAATGTAACPTCCPQAGATCVVCGTKSCTSVADYYEGQVGPNGCGVRVT